MVRSCTGVIHLICILLCFTLIGLCSGGSNVTLGVVPRFLDVPPPVSYFTETPFQNQNAHIDLICRAWPPNAKIALLTSQLSADCQSTPSCSPITLEPLAQDFGQQRFAILSSGAHLSGSLSNAIVHESMADAVRDRPAADPNDEVAILLRISSMSEVQQLDGVRLHCLVATAFGQVLSPPFRVLSSRLGDFAPTPERASGPTHTVEYCTNNIAAVECRLPPNSFPTPVVSFELNDTLISPTALQSDKYRVVWRPDRQSVSLLIHGVQFGDWGTYRCFLTNPLTGEKKYSPESTLIKLISPKSPVAPTITVDLASSADPNASRTAADRSQKIVVHEGQNVTLFCIIQGAPPPTVATYPFAPNATDYNRFQTDRKFGLLHIINVQPRDAGFYICSNGHVSSTAQLYVKPRLRLTTQPEDLRLNQLGVPAQFKCSTSESSVPPVWLFNGQLVQNKPSDGTGISVNGDTLELPSVSAMHLGLYQCAALRSADPINPFGPADQWVSTSATLSLASNRIIRTAPELSEFIPQQQSAGGQQITPESVTNELTPEVQVLYDNLAASVFWQPLTLDQTHGSPQSVEYRLEYSVQISPAFEPANNQLTSPALIGLVGHDAVRWSDPEPLREQTTRTFSYVTELVLKPSKRYRFRVIAIDPATGVNLAPPSAWSNVVSTEHISAVEPPQIKAAKPLSQGRVHVVWTFDGAAHIVTSAKSRLLSGGSTDLPAVGPGHPSSIQPSNPLWDSESNLFVPHYFLLLARPVVKPESRSTESIKYGTYLATQINGSTAREGILSGLNNSAKYQVIVYAVRGDGDKRQITRFSRAVFVNFVAAGPHNLWRALTSNRLMYLILAGIAALMFFVVFIFILMCICRQQRDRRIAASQRGKKQNGFTRGYKDTTNYLPVSTTDGGPPNRSGAGTISNRGVSASTPMMMMSNLQNGAFSDPSQAQMSTNPMLASHQNDRYSAHLMNEMMLQQQQQQQQSLLGSQMHLQQQEQQQAFRPQHHQSNQSLLMSPGGVPPQPSGTVYQSGTLPGGPSRGYNMMIMRQQFGSQQPLNRTQMMVDPQEFYNQQNNIYAHQQPQLPPVPHPQNAEMHPSMSNGTPMHPQQMVYYPSGTMTPSAAVSLKREPPTGGPLQDGSAYGTLLQRGHLTGSMINDRSSVLSGSMRPVSGHHPGLVYYPHGSQQALHHMMQQNCTGMSTPQAAPMYSPRQQQAMFFAQQQQQQQQQQYPGYFVQQMQQQQQPDGLGHGPFVHPTDGESIYSYFSQQDMGQPGMAPGGPHQTLNPLPEENQMHAGVPNGGYVESGMQTNTGAGDGLPESSPAGGNHRHHRRRRRKQQRQLSDNPINGEQANGVGHDSGDMADESGPPMSEQPGDAQLEDRRPMFEQDFAAQKHHQVLPGTDATDLQNFNSPQAYQGQQNGHMMSDSNRSGQTRYDSSQQLPLPPPNQPPPPPPPPGMANGFSPGENPAFANQNYLAGGDSLSRRLYQANSPSGLLVGPPPRMRDYSEYGIPRGIGLPPTPSGGGQPQPSQHNALMHGQMNPGSPPQHVNGGTMMYAGRYREGQA